MEHFAKSVKKLSVLQDADDKRLDAKRQTREIIYRFSSLSFLASLDPPGPFLLNLDSFPISFFSLSSSQIFLHKARQVSAPLESARNNLRSVSPSFSNFLSPVSLKLNFLSPFLVENELVLGASFERPSSASRDCLNRLPQFRSGGHPD